MSGRWKIAATLIPMVLAFFSALAAVWLGIWGERLVAGQLDPLSNAIRALQWETLSAGLFGLTGGLAVIFAVSWQISKSDLLAAQSRKDILMSDINAQFAEIDDFLVGCRMYACRIKFLAAGEDEKTIAQWISERMDYRRIRGYQGLRFADWAERLEGGEGITLALADQFAELRKSLRNVLGGVSGAHEYAITYADELIKKIEDFQSALIEYKRQRLTIRYV